MISCLAAFCPIHKRLLFTPCPITFYVYRSYKYKKNPYLAILLFARIYRGKMVTAHSVPSNENVRMRRYAFGTKYVPCQLWHNTGVMEVSV